MIHHILPLECNPMRNTAFKRLASAGNDKIIGVQLYYKSKTSSMGQELHKIAYIKSCPPELLRHFPPGNKLSTNDYMVE